MGAIPEIQSAARLFARDRETRYGEPVGSGVYFYWIRAEGFQETRKMVLVC